MIMIIIIIIIIDIQQLVAGPVLRLAQDAMSVWAFVKGTLLGAPSL